MKMIVYCQPPASNSDCRSILFIISLFFIILVIFWRMQKFICFSLNRAMFVRSTLLRQWRRPDFGCEIWYLEPARVSRDLLDHLDTINTDYSYSHMSRPCLLQSILGIYYVTHYYFIRFHWISHGLHCRPWLVILLALMWGFPTPLGDGAMRHGSQCSYRAVYCPWMTSSMIGRPLWWVQTNHLSSLWTGLFYKARCVGEFRAYMKQPDSSPNVCRL